MAVFPNHVVTAGYFTPDVVARMIEHEAWIKGVWGKMIGAEIRVKNGDFEFQNEYDASKPVVRYLSEFVEKGTDRLILPQTRRLTEEGIYGDEQQSGKEETQAMYMSDLMVNLRGHAVNTHIGLMNDLRGMKMRQAAEAKPQLSRWWSEVLEFDICTLAMYEGFSKNLTKSGNTPGITKRYHPNFYIADQGFVTWSATVQTYINSIVGATGVDGLAKLDDACTDARKMSADLLDKIRATLWLKNINPAATIEGMDYWLLYVHPRTYAQIRDDEKIMRTTESAFRGQGLKDPMLSGAALYYNGFVIMENPLIAPEVHNDSTGTKRVFFGPVSGSEDTLAARNIHLYKESSTDAEKNLVCSLILGSDALSYGTAGGGKMVPKVDTYDSKESIAFKIITGASRRDWSDVAMTHGSPTVSENTSSMVIVTNCEDMI